MPLLRHHPDINHGVTVSFSIGPGGPEQTHLTVVNRMTRVGARVSAISQSNEPAPMESNSSLTGGLQRMQILDDVLEREIFLLGFLGDPIDLIKGRNAADDLQHAVGVKR